MLINDLDDLTALKWLTTPRLKQPTHLKKKPKIARPRTEEYAFYIRRATNPVFNNYAYLSISTTKNNFSITAAAITRKTKIYQRGGKNRTFGSKRNSNSTGYMAGARLAHLCNKKTLTQFAYCFVTGVRPTVRGILTGFSKHSRALKKSRIVYKPAIPFNGSRGRAARRR